MNCNHAATLVEALADGELDRSQTGAVERHLSDCAACSAAHTRVLELRRRLRDEAGSYRAPPELVAQLRAQAAAIAPSTSASAGASLARRWFGWRGFGGGLLTGCAATVAAWFLVGALIEHGAAADLATEAVSAHVRATLGAHVIDVASSDQHTVKPWLSARLDYAPPVRDMAESGFPLAGARLDYLNGHHIAVLVYRYRQHVVDVFVWPQDGREPALPPASVRTLRGFNVVRASGTGMAWMAVSDLNAEAMGTLVRSLAHPDAVASGP
jgi:anti-sigma factor RsiW